VLAPWAVVAWIFFSPRPGLAPAGQRQPPVTAAAASTAPTSPHKLRAGPWGKVEYASIAIEPPEEFIPSDYQAAPARWIFKSTSAAALEKLWDDAQLTPHERASLNQPQRRELTAEGIVLSPEPDLVLNLNAAARARIYTALAAFPENAPQREPFRFRSDSLDEWFSGSDLPEEILTLTKRLVYYRNNAAFFSDYDLVLPRIQDSRTRTLYLKTLSRKSALILTLRVDDSTDIDALAAYWGRGRRAKDVKPLLQSLRRQPGLHGLDVVHLVPRFARSLLYTFPLPSDDPNSVNRDCHWTSFNFYSEEPDDRFTDIEFVKQTLMNNYYPVAGEPQLGDVLMFVQPGGVVIHSCVYIADDIVFTKNGPSFAVPWQFAKLDAVLAFYTVGDLPIEIRRYRPKSH
jgi:hypothetical protein